MGDIGDYWRDVKPILKKEAQKWREEGYDATDRVLEEAEAKAKAHGLKLKDTLERRHGYTGWT